MHRLSNRHWLKSNAKKTRMNKVHLNNEQLLEPDDASLAHLSQCQQCQSRLENLNLLRGRLNSFADATTYTGDWQRVKQAYLMEENVSSLDTANRTVRFWRFTSGAIAASFALFLIWQSVSVLPESTDQLPDASFVALVDENSALQSQLNLQLSGNQEINSKAASLLIELDMINTKLQKAYLEKGSKIQKQEPWQQRQVLLESTLAAIGQPGVIKI